MKNNLNKEIKEWLVKNYKGKSKEAIEGIKKEFGIELKPQRLYNLTKKLGIANRRQEKEAMAKREFLEKLAKINGLRIHDMCGNNIMEKFQEECV